MFPDNFRDWFIAACIAVVLVLNFVIWSILLIGGEELFWAFFTGG